MRRPGSLPSFFRLLLASAALLLTGSAAHAVPYYWDSDGSTAGGSAGTTAAGTWGTDNWWNTSSTGVAGTFVTSLTSADTAFFSAGTDVTGTYTVTVNGTQSVGGVTFDEGNVTLSGGQLNLSGNLAAIQNATIDSAIALQTNSLWAAPGKILTVGGAITTGANTLTLHSSGSNNTVNMSSTASFSGNLKISNGGSGNSVATLNNGAVNQMTAANVDMTASAAVGIAVWNLSGFNQTISGLSSSTGGNQSWIGNSSATAATLTVDTSTNSTFRGGIQNGTTGAAALSFVKEGTGTLTLSQSSMGFALAGGWSNTPYTYTGTTTVNEGRLVLSNANGFRSATTVASNATVELNAASNWVLNNGASFSGAGTFVKSGAAILSLGGNNYAIGINFASGGLIDIQGGTLRQEWGYDKTTWSSNLASMNIASGATFDIWDYGQNNGQQLKINALTGQGTFDKGWTGAATLQVGVNHGSGDFQGVVKNTSGTLNLVKTGSGTQTLSGADTYTGTTTISNGKLLVNGTHTNAGAYTVNSGGTLGGTGSITTNNANVTIASGGFLSPGASTGTLTLNLGSGTLNLSSIAAGALVFELGVIGASDQVVLNSGTLNIGTLNFNEFNFIPVSGISLGTYKLFDSANPVTGSLGTTAGFFSNGQWGGFLWLDNGNRDVMLTLDFTTVPEPSTLLLAALGAVGLFWNRRRRRV